ncbi:MAG TPA: calcium/proton exchanger [Gemmatimonadota bacterium]|jgi:Ca2+:H+ antiporter|nr:calcium/proton exchanger [Gemmatimonadota bacterium]
MRGALKPSLNWLLPLTPIAIAVRLAAPDAHVWLFFLASIAIVPLAGWMGKATEHLAARTGEGIGGLLNATFGNMAEIIIAIMALREGLTEIVKASLTGSIIGNALLVLGASMLGGGLKFKIQEFNPAGGRTRATQLTLAAIALLVPALFHHLAGPAGPAREGALSLEISILILIVYALALVFSLHTHERYFTRETAEAVQLEDETHASWSVRRSLGILVGATLLVSALAEILVASVETTAATLGMTEVFVGVIVVAIVGNAAEHSTAILMAIEDRMDLAMGIAIGSATQIALFAAPVLVLLSYVIGPAPMDLVFTTAEVVAVAVSVIIVGQVAEDGESNWLEGVQLLAVYLILAVMFYFLPETIAAAE